MLPGPWCDVAESHAVSHVDTLAQDGCHASHAGHR